MTSRARSDGYSVVELLIAIAVLVPLLVAIWSTTDIVTRTSSTIERRSEAGSALSRGLQRVGQVIRPAVRSTLRVPATAEDQARARVAGAAVPAIGDWVEPQPGQTGDRVRFECASGRLSMNAAERTAPRQLHFVLDGGETENGSDDNRNGLVDEGEVRLLHDGRDVVLARGIERFQIAIDGDVVRIAMGAARRAADGVVHRSGVTQVLTVRNR